MMEPAKLSHGATSKHSTSFSLYLANKLSSKHTSFEIVKMKVSVAAQTLSSSVDTALDHLRDDLHIPAFHGSKPTYHLEIFFSKIRRRGGWNNNPSTEQFRHSLRILLHQNEVKAPFSGNTIQLDETEDIFVEDTAGRRKSPRIDAEFVVQAENLESAVLFADNEWQTSCLVYTAGFICRRLTKKKSNVVNARQHLKTTWQQTTGGSVS
ncbi:THAP domain-containing protein 9 [Plakobranchus ocellatus]|uniref:THAP domain-containing protein 9 n=1 Tax=Plakobranchus ocellatus TaxID=259542 RepID=A0AAV4C115_9GAST|nr:THAP domain-containing protein 9 [Plakobranchus ocellatus]